MGPPTWTSAPTFYCHRSSLHAAPAPPPPAPAAQLALLPPGAPWCHLLVSSLHQRLPSPSSAGPSSSQPLDWRPEGPGLSSSTPLREVTSFSPTAAAFVAPTPTSPKPPTCKHSGREWMPHRQLRGTGAGGDSGPGPSQETDTTSQLLTPDPRCHPVSLPLAHTPRLSAAGPSLILKTGRVRGGQS